MDMNSAFGFFFFESLKSVLFICSDSIASDNELESFAPFVRLISLH